MTVLLLCCISKLLTELIILWTRGRSDQLSLMSQQFTLWTRAFSPKNQGTTMLIKKFVINLLADMFFHFLEVFSYQSVFYHPKTSMQLSPQSGTKAWFGDVMIPPYSFFFAFLGFSKVIFWTNVWIMSALQSTVVMATISNCIGPKYCCIQSRRHVCE